MGLKYYNMFHVVRWLVERTLVKKLIELELSECGVIQWRCLLKGFKCLESSYFHY